MKAKPSSFGFGVVVHPKDPDTAWFVPGIKDEKRYPVDGKLVVTRTRDGGKSFDVLSNGLPQEHAYDIVFRHALAGDEHRRPAGLRLDHGEPVGERGPGRFVDDGEHVAAADPCGAVCVAMRSMCVIGRSTGTACRTRSSCINENPGSSE